VSCARKLADPILAPAIKAVLDALGPFQVRATIGNQTRLLTFSLTPVSPASDFCTVRQRAYCCPWRCPAVGLGQLAGPTGETSRSSPCLQHGRECLSTGANQLSVFSHPSVTVNVEDALLRAVWDRSPHRSCTDGTGSDRPRTRCCRLQCWRVWHSAGADVPASTAAAANPSPALANCEAVWRQFRTPPPSSRGGSGLHRGTHSGLVVLLGRSC